MVSNLMKFSAAALVAAALGAGSAAAQDFAPVPDVFSETARGERTRLTPMELTIWQSDDFRRRFVESYIAETDIEPRVTEDERELMFEILDLISAEQVDEAALALERELNRNAAASAVFDFTLANIYFQREEYETAAAHYQDAVEKYPKFLRAWRNLSLIHVRESSFPEAIRALTRVVELGGGDSVTYGLLGFAYSNEENFLPAQTAYETAILLDPETMDWQMGLARALFKQQRYPEAIALTGRLLEDEPERTDLWLLQANAYLGQGQAEEAAKVYELVDLLGGSTPDSLNMLGDIYVNQELYNLAAASYLRAMELAPDAAPARAVRSARILAARGAFDETKQLLSSIETNYGEELPTEERVDLLKLRGRLAVAEGAAEEEVEVLKEIVELDPLDGEALILLGQASNRDGDAEQAVFYFERAANIEGFEADALVRHAQVLVGEGNYEDALPLLRRAQQVNFRENVQEYLEQVERVSRTS